MIDYTRECVSDIIKMKAIVFVLGFGLVFSQKAEVLFESMIVEQEQATTFRCDTGQLYETCAWTLPTEETCANILPNDTSQCRTVSNVYYNTTSTACNILVKNIHESHNGNWTCLQDGVPVAKIDVGIFHKGSLDCNSYGTIKVNDGKQYSIECEVKHARPVGEMIWRIGTKENSSEKSASSTVEKDKNGRFTLTETLREVSDISDDGSSIYVTYRQKNSDDEILNINEEIFDLRVNYLRILQKTIPVIRPGAFHNISVFILANQLPQVKWEIKNKDELHTLSSNMNRNIFKILIKFTSS